MTLGAGLLLWVPIAFGVLVVVLGAIFLGVLLPAARKAAAADFVRQRMEVEAAEDLAAREGRAVAETAGPETIEKPRAEGTAEESAGSGTGEETARRSRDDRNG